MDEKNDKVYVNLAKEIVIRDQYGGRHILNAVQWLLHAWFRPELKKN